MLKQLFGAVTLSTMATMALAVTLEFNEVSRCSNPPYMLLLARTRSSSAEVSTTKADLSLNRTALPSDQRESRVQQSFLGTS